MTANLLLLGPSPDSVDERTRRGARLREQLASFLGEGHTLDAVLLAGVRGRDDTAYQEAGRLLDGVLEQCIDNLPAGHDLPVVVCAPGPHDLDPVRSGSMLARALTRDWTDTSADVWSGEAQDVLEALHERFSAYRQWADAWQAPDLEWRHGLLPGDQSLRIEVGGLRIGLVGANTVFRMLTTEAQGDLATCAPEQLDAAVGRDWTEWTAGNRATVLLASHAVRAGAEPTSGSPLLPVAERAGTPARDPQSPSWNLLNDEGHQILRLDADGAGGLHAWKGTGPEPSATRRLTLWPVGTGAAAAPPRPSTRLAAQPAPAAPRAALQDFYRHIASGRMILVVGSGLVDAGGQGPVSLDELNRRLARAVFGQVPSPEPRLAETWAAVRRRLEDRQVETYLDALKTDDGPTPYAVKRLLQTPWSVVYDFSGSDLLRKGIAADPDLARTALSVDATTDWPTSVKITEYVAMQGFVGDGLGTVDFSEYRTDGAPPRSDWLQRFLAEALFQPVAFLSLAPDSASLWQLVDLVAPPGTESSYPRFVVTPAGGVADGARLEQAGITHIPMDVPAFCHDVLRPGIESLEQGHRELSRLRSTEQTDTGISLVATLVDAAGRGSEDFLKGREPTWAEIKNQGFAARLSQLARIKEAAAPGPNGLLPVVIVEGRAGSGKSTALMQFGYDLHAAGKSVGWIDRDSTQSRGRMEDQALSVGFDAVLVDDVDIFKRSSAPLLRSLNAQGRTLVVATVRTTRRDEVAANFPATRVSFDRALTDDDLKNLLRTLKKRRLLGKFAGYPESLRVEKLREICERSLLAAMIQVVTGERFEDKVRSEFDELDALQAAAYAAVCLCDSQQVFSARGIHEVDLALIVSRGRPSPRIQRAIASLLESNLLTLGPNRTVRSKQRTIADTVLSSILKNRPERLEEILSQLLLFYSSRAGHQRDYASPYRRVMERLLNHRLMLNLGLSPYVVRRIYALVHDRLSSDFHYWLQCGEYELENGDLDIARNYMETARACTGGDTDHRVLTTWSSVILSQSTGRPRDDELARQALDAIDCLDSVARRYGGKTPHTFAVLATAGTKWLESLGRQLTDAVFFRVAQLIAGTIDDGRLRCADNTVFLKVADRREPELRALMERRRGVLL
ncbi:hypothetical protein RVR_5434 [Actinacidiphila reveromycinica]|uniref:Novel STAND NTPase 5 domain-containing protein n=1 Tax=Actinacidiphila reveromycinica TaxID=659352 RepID=A0A7U3UUJ1_9ACTN|nr:hypothetical protein [Streptomyces sp. SN-593]BBA98995.1 hypothetical protein RVR_5434 [Streptomyces sp. SN-593]